MSDRLDRNFAKELSAAFKAVDVRLGINQEIAIRVPEDPVRVPDAMMTPPGSFYTVFRRSNKGYNKRAFYRLPFDEALKKAEMLNEKEIEKREILREKLSHSRDEDDIKDFKSKLSEAFFYEAVLEGAPDEDVYWNPPMKSIPDLDRYSDGGIR